MITFTELLERAENDEIVVHTPTEEQAKALLTELDKRGYQWCTRQELTVITFYEYYKENTCYSFRDCCGKLRNKKVWYSPLDFYQKYGYLIIEFADIDFTEKNN